MNMFNESRYKEQERTNNLTFR